MPASFKQFQVQEFCLCCRPANQQRLDPDSSCHLECACSPQDCVFLKCMARKHWCSSMSYAAMLKHAWIAWITTTVSFFVIVSPVWIIYPKPGWLLYRKVGLRQIFFAMRSGDRRVTNLAYELHQSVPADRWCVTYLDLIFLRQEVKTALGCGQIRPEPDVSEAYGPSIYTVTDQYIKPVTRQAGKMSWALMRNPDGLECDLFISHAWQEGVFEFLSKVRRSWPRGVKTAWCCMLANPQNLDISWYFVLFAVTNNFALCHCIESCWCHVGGAKPPPERVHKTLVPGWQNFAVPFCSGRLVQEFHLSLHPSSFTWYDNIWYVYIYIKVSTGQIF